MTDVPVSRDDESMSSFASSTAAPIRRSFALDLAQLGPLDGEARHQQRKHRDDGDGHRKIEREQMRPLAPRAAVRSQSGAAAQVRQK